MRAETAHPAVVARCRARADWLTSAKRVKRALSCGAGGAEAARAKRAVAHGFVSLLSETAAWSMAVLHVTAAEAHAEAVNGRVRNPRSSGQLPARHTHTARAKAKGQGSSGRRCAAQDAGA